MQDLVHLDLLDLFVIHQVPGLVGVLDVAVVVSTGDVSALVDQHSVESVLAVLCLLVPIYVLPDVQLFRVLHRPVNFH